MWFPTLRELVVAVGVALLAFIACTIEGSLTSSGSFAIIVRQPVEPQHTSDGEGVVDGTQYTPIVHRYRLHLVERLVEGRIFRQDMLTDLVINTSVVSDVVLSREYVQLDIRQKGLKRVLEHMY